jgi:hypothetical protein
MTWHSAIPPTRHPLCTEDELDASFAGGRQIRWRETDSTFGRPWRAETHVPTGGQAHRDPARPASREQRPPTAEVFRQFQYLTVPLEPFQNLEVELLLAHADGFPAAQFMADAFAGHPRVRTDPLGSTG